MSIPKKILEEVMSLEGDARAELADCLLRSLENVDSEVEKVWQQETEVRLDAYEKGEMKALRIEEVIAKYK